MTTVSPPRPPAELDVARTTFRARRSAYAFSRMSRSAAVGLAWAYTPDGGERAMTSQWVLTDRDVRDLLDVLERCDGIDDADIFYPDVLAGLHGLIPCDDISFQLMDVREQRIRVLAVTEEGVQRA